MPLESSGLCWLLKPVCHAGNHYRKERAKADNSDFKFYKADAKVKCSLWHHHSQNVSLCKTGRCPFLFVAHAMWKMDLADISNTFIGNLSHAFFYHARACVRSGTDSFPKRAFSFTCCKEGFQHFPFGELSGVTFCSSSEEKRFLWYLLRAFFCTEIEMC